MTISVHVTPSGEAAFVTTGAHTTPIVGIGDAKDWVAFYREMHERYRHRSGARYDKVLAAFEQALAEMVERQKRDVA